MTSANNKNGGESVGSSQQTGNQSDSRPVSQRARDDNSFGGYQPGEIIIELGTALNQQVHFNPMRQAYRGRMDRMNMGAELSSDAAELILLTIPGLYIGLDIEGRKAQDF